MADPEKKQARAAKSPYETSGILARLTFTYTFPLFYKGFKFGLAEKDLYPHLPAHDSNLLGTKLEDEWNKEIRNNKKNPSFWKALVRVFGKEMMLLGVFILAYELIRISLPLSLSKLLDYFEPNSTMTINEAYIYAGLVSVATLVQVFVIHNAIFHIFHMGQRIRVAAATLVYRKAIKLSKSSLAETTVGQMVNLISNDVSRFELCTINLHNLWVGPIELFVILYLLYSNVGWTGLPGVGLLLLFIPFQMWMGKKTSIYRLRTAIRTDERIHLMNEIISGIQIIKMYTWEKPFAKLVEIIRKSEMNEIQKNSVIRALTMSFNIFLTRVLIYICILVFILTGNSLNAKYVYVLSLFYELLRQGVSQAVAQGITQLAEAIISMKRIKEFLMFGEVDDPSLPFNVLSLTMDKNKLTGTGDIGIRMENVSAKWVESTNDNSLENINFNVKPGELATIIGKVGSGKTTLLHVILKELPPVTGILKVNGIVSYASQEPWLFAGSVRDNILFGQIYDVVKYQEVIRACALERDLTLLPQGDRTFIGERGVSLSGGQRARINLARAVYREADIYLLDDPLSAVDARVGKQIFDQCIDDYLKDKCVVLITHQLQYLKNCKKIYLLNNGKIDKSGTYEEIEKSGKDFTKLLEELKKMQEEAKKEAKDAEKQRQRTVSAEEDIEESESLENPTAEKEDIISGKVTWKVYKSYFLAGGHMFKIIAFAFLFAISQAIASGTDYFLSIWVNMEESKRIQRYDEIAYNNTNNITENADQSVFEQFWFGVFTTKVCLIAYTVLIIIVVLLLVSRAILFFRYCVHASITLHNNMFSKIVYANMRFFNINPSGRILNRFSKDMNLVDEWLPLNLADTLQIGLMMVGVTILVASVSPVMLVPTGIILVIFYLIRVVFIRTSRDIKRFEATTRSPVYSHLTASLQGLTTIRAFSAQGMLRKQFDDYQDVYSSAYFMFMSANRAFGFWLDIHTVIFVTLVTFSFLLMKTEAFGGSVGLAITQSISLTGWFQWGIRQWSEMENTMTSVERIKQYADIFPEEDENAKEPPKNWPETGTVTFNDVSLRYSQESPDVLSKLNFTINSTEKVGIVGRTGAGKSSIIAALFRLFPLDGEIAIDGVDSKTVPLNKLRSSLSIIPQEPVLFSGTLRKNLDPFDEYQDAELWNALEEVELKGIVADMPQGLESKMSEGGSNFSVGQRQLVCLARAIVRDNKILVLDEATANVDPHTDGLIQATIRRKFRSCTVLTIAHRLHTIMDSDKVLVMDAGQMVEFAHPYELLQNSRGVFSQLVKQTGRAMAGNLSDIAEKSYKNLQNKLEEANL